MPAHVITKAKAARRRHHNRVQSRPYAVLVHRARFEAMKVAQLQDIARENGVKLIRKATKAQIVDALLVTKVRGPLPATLA